MTEREPGERPIRWYHDLWHAVRKTSSQMFKRSQADSSYDGYDAAGRPRLVVGHMLSVSRRRRGFCRMRESKTRLGFIQ